MFELSCEMEFPEDQYFKINRVLLSLVGLWPYEDLKVRHFRFILSVLIMITFIGTQIKEFRERLRNNWDALKDKEEIEIICKHGNTGKLFTIFIAVLVYSILFLYISQYISVLLNIAISLNESGPRELLFPAEYFIDQQKYFYVITIHVSLGLLVIGTTGIATESFSLANALHAFGLFKIASYRMKKVLDGINRTDMCLNKEYARSCNKIIAAVDFHKRAIEFSELLKGSFGRMYLAMFVGCVCSIGVNLSTISRLLIMEKEIFFIIKYVLCIILSLTCLTLANYAGQEFINSDTHVYRTICNMKWYNASLKTQKLILFLIQKTTKCYKVDAGGMFSPCLEGLTTAVSMSVSYFMVLRSTF
ncbi:PREDICTED: odorant receptor 63a-like [Vollenhovia emeryi]|uniref:odorant receptor 63a-like n=1 Tax=Vollenhovia emeryi TaxID=411798 RepID=UPI0005F42B7D|nr:PREDICTED: odorant receptor 63a-like [Vollenhovia emeryi]